MVVLADEMGMGKTIQTIALLLQRKHVDHGARSNTLIVCPVVALLQVITNVTLT